MAKKMARNGRIMVIYKYLSFRIRVYIVDKMVWSKFLQYFLPLATRSGLYFAAIVVSLIIRDSNSAHSEPSLGLRWKLRCEDLRPFPQ